VSRAATRRPPLPTSRALVSGGLVLAAFTLLFGPALADLVAAWWTSGEYGHGFLLLPIAGWLGWRRRVEGADAEAAGVLVLATGTGLFLLGALAGESFTQWLAILVALAGLTIHHRGWAQLRAWWLPFALLLSTIPLPDVVLDTVTLPLQLFASSAAVWLLDARHIPAAQAGNVIFLPGQELFVAVACSGLRSLSALLGLTLLIAGTTLSSGPGRVALLGLAIPAAIGANVVRVWATGFGAYYIGPEVATGPAHHVLAAGAFGLPLVLVGALAYAIRRLEA